jgi:hypothetical protein
MGDGSMAIPNSQNEFQFVLLSRPSGDLSSDVLRVALWASSKRLYIVYAIFTRD